MPDKTFITVKPPLKAVDNGNGSIKADTGGSDEMEVWLKIQEI